MFDKKSGANSSTLQELTSQINQMQTEMQELAQKFASIRKTGKNDKVSKLTQTRIEMENSLISLSLENDAYEV